MKAITRTENKRIEVTLGEIVDLALNDKTPKTKQQMGNMNGATCFWGGIALGLAGATGITANGVPTYYNHGKLFFDPFELISAVDEMTDGFGSSLMLENDSFEKNVSKATLAKKLQSRVEGDKQLSRKVVRVTIRTVEHSF